MGGGRESETMARITWGGGVGMGWSSCDELTNCATMPNERITARRVTVKRFRLRGGWLISGMTSSV